MSFLKLRYFSQRECINIREWYLKSIARYNTTTTVCCSKIQNVHVVPRKSYSSNLRWIQFINVNIIWIVLLTRICPRCFRLTRHPKIYFSQKSLDLEKLKNLFQIHFLKKLKIKFNSVFLTIEKPHRRCGWIFKNRNRLDASFLKCALQNILLW